MAASMIRHTVLRVAHINADRGVLFFKTPIIGTSSIILANKRFKSLYHNPKFRKERGQKVIEQDLPDYDEMRTDRKRTPGDVRQQYKKDNVQPPREFNEFDIIISSTTDIFEPYVPPEGDGVASIISGAGTKQRITQLEKKGKSALQIRKIKKLDDTFDTKQFPEKAMEIYMEAHQLLENVDENESRLHELVTEKAYPEMTWKLKRKTFRWKYIEAIEPPRVVHARTTSMLSKDNLYGQVTVRFHTKQLLAIYDQFGRLMFGSETVPKDSLEYVVFENHLGDTYGSWRMHGKVFPEWMPPKQTILRTLRKPKLEDIVEIDDGKGESTTPESKSQPQLASA